MFLLKPDLFDLLSQVKQMLSNMKPIMEHRVKSLSWMDRATKEIAIKKVTSLVT